MILNKHKEVYPQWKKKEKSLNKFKDPQVELLSISVPNN